MNTITHVQALELIDVAAQENRLYHHNGGQAYIRVSMSLNVLMIIDHTRAHHPEITFHDGTKYFIDCVNYNFEHSHRLREHGSLAEWFKNTYPEKAAV
jgi:hypothetical protein